MAVSTCSGLRYTWPPCARRLIAGIAFAGLGLGLFLGHSQGFSQNPPEPAPNRPRPLRRTRPTPAPKRRRRIAKYCATCHNERLRTAGLALDPAGVARPGDQSETWEKVLRQLRAGTMPPPGAARPPQAFYTRAAAYLARELEASAAARPNPGSLPLAHRLTRTEYGNVIRDLLALPDLPKELDYATLLPADNASSGFDNLADTLFVSPATMERYLAAARKISRVAVGDPEMGVLVNTHITPVRQPQDGRNEELPFGTRGGLEIDGYFPLDGEYEFKVADGRRRGATSISWRSASTASARPSRTSRGGQAFRRAGRCAEPGRLPLRRAGGAAQRGRRLPGAQRGAVRGSAAAAGPEPWRPALGRVGDHHRSVQRDGSRRHAQPPAAVRVPARQRRAEESACADRILTTLLRRAYRRDVTADDLRRVRRFYEAGRAERDFDLGIQRALERVLVSPQFLFRIEQEPAGAAPGSVYRVSDFELASRLSFFLWSSIPDDELLDAAAAGTLRQPDVLRRQVNRMLADPRSRSLVTNFAAQWLFLRDVETKEPDVYLFRDFDEGVRAAFVRETELFLDSILRENRSVLDLMTADYTFLNEPLAKHYGIPHITGSHFRRVTLPKGSPRRGLLGHGSILSITSYSTRTSAVLRGKYVLENLLASPPPPPPPDVPSLNTERSGQPLSMKEAMQLHRANPACAGCHAKMDPIGFALENFDATRAVARRGERPSARRVERAAGRHDG